MASKRKVPKGLTLTERLKWERESGKLSYAQLGSLIGGSASEAHDWTNGKSEPTLRRLRRIAEGLECEVADLVVGL